MSTPKEILNVECPDCGVPIGEECDEPSVDEPGWHVARARNAKPAKAPDPSMKCRVHGNLGCRACHEEKFGP